MQLPWIYLSRKMQACYRNWRRNQPCGVVNWRVTLFPADGHRRPRVINDVINYEIIPSTQLEFDLAAKWTPSKAYVVFNFGQGGHITVLFSRSQYSRFEIHNAAGNFVVGHGSTHHHHAGKLIQSKD